MEGVMRFIATVLMAGMVAQAGNAQQVETPAQIGPIASFNLGVGPGWGVSGGLGITYADILKPAPQTGLLPAQDAMPLQVIPPPNGRLGVDLNLTFSFSF